MRRYALLPCCMLVAAMGTAPAAARDDAGADPIVVQVGSTALHASELRFKLGRLHEFERQSYGKTPDEIRRAYVERRVVPELLSTEDAKRRGALESPAVIAKVRDALTEALKDDLERQIDAKLKREELAKACKDATGERASDACRDLTGYRVLLRRERARDELARLARELRQRDVKNVDYALLERVPTPSATPSAKQTEPQAGERD